MPLSHPTGECAAILEKQRIKPSYYEVAKATYPWAQILVDGAIALKCFVVSISYLLIVGQLVPEALMEGFGVPATSIWVNRRFWVSLIFVLVAPIAALKKLGCLPLNYRLAPLRLCDLLCRNLLPQHHDCVFLLRSEIR